MDEFLRRLIMEQLSASMPMQRPPMEQSFPASLIEALMGARVDTRAETVAERDPRRALLQLLGAEAPPIRPGGDQFTPLFNESGMGNMQFLKDMFTFGPPISDRSQHEELPDRTAVATEKFLHRLALKDFMQDIASRESRVSARR